MNHERFVIPRHHVIYNHAEEAIPMEKAEELGGADLEDYMTPDEKRACDKIRHFLRSLAHQPNHEKHLKEIIPDGEINTPQ